MTKEKQNKIIYIRLAVVSAFFFIAFISFFNSRLSSTIYSQSKPKPTPKSVKPIAKATPQNSKYSDFQHKTHIDLKLACDSCHKVPTSNWDKVRDKDKAFPDVTDYPKHESCINCHRQQFFSGKPPAICANCHTNPSPNDSSRHPFPNPREIFDASPKGKTATSEFAIHFSHEKHIEIVSQNENPFEMNRNGVAFINASAKRGSEDSCKVCHQTYQPQGKSDVEYFTTPPKDLGDGFWLKKGTFKTSSLGHTTCFTCHSADTGITPLPTDCATCHQPKPTMPIADFDKQLAEKMSINDKIMLEGWRKRDSSGKFQHEFAAHVDMDCSTCHTVTKMDTLDFKTKKVGVSSCAPCHITATSDDGGILNMEIDSRKKDAKFECIKCHISFGKLPVPDSHTKAIADQK